MRILKNCLIGLVILIAVLAAVGMLLPRSVTVTRSIIIDAPPSAVFPLVNSMQRTEEWSPWLAMDPEVALTYSGPSQGVGNTLEWSSDNPKVGTGRQEITQSEDNKRVATALDFGDMGLATAQFDLVSMGGGTEVTWGLVADMGNTPIGRWMGLLMDRLVGADYEKGLINLKKAVEG